MNILKAVTFTLLCYVILILETQSFSEKSKVENIVQETSAVTGEPPEEKLAKTSELIIAAESQSAKREVEVPDSPEKTFIKKSSVKKQLSSKDKKSKVKKHHEASARKHRQANIYKESPFANWKTLHLHRKNKNITEVKGIAGESGKVCTGLPKSQKYVCIASKHRCVILRSGKCGNKYPPAKPSYAECMRKCKSVNNVLKK